MENTILSAIRRHKIIAIARKVHAQFILDTVHALYAGGVRMVEVTFDHSGEGGIDNTLASIKTLVKHAPGDMLIGAGTVLTPEQVILARDAGAKYIISPDANPAVIRRAKELNLCSLPGALTPTEITTAVSAGADAVKLFPAGELGVKYVKAVTAPLSHIPLIAVGGIDEHNISEYLAAGCIGAGIGTGIVNNALIVQGQFDSITALAKKYMTEVNT